MKVILLENIKRIGSIGEVIDVKRGFARNFLISNKKANGTIAKNPTKNRTALNVKGPISSIPVSWAINVVPQIKVHNSALSNDTVFDIIF